MKKLITLHFCCFLGVLCHFSAFSNIIPVIKSGLAVNMTPNSNFIRAADFDAGSFVEGGSCATPLIISFDANGLVLQKDIRTTCAGAQFVYIYLTNACDPSDQAKVRTFLDVQNNAKLPNVSVCGDGVIFNTLATLTPEPNAPIFPMSVASNGIAVSYAVIKNPFLLKWNENVNAGSQAGAGTITDKHVIVSPPANNPIPLVWKSEILVTCACIGPKIITLWSKNSFGNASFVTTFMDVQVPPSDNTNLPIAYAYNGLATRLIPNQPFNIPASVWDKGSYSPINSPLTFSMSNGDLNYKVAVYGPESIKLLVKDAQNNKNIVGTYLDIQKETLMKGAFSLPSSNTVATYNMTDVSRTYNWQLDGKMVGTNINTYKTPSNLTVGKHILKATFGTTPQSYDETEIIITVVGSVSTAEQKAAEVLIYPNPIVDYLQIQTNQDGSCVAEFSDIMGRVVQQNIINGTTSQLDCTELQSGVYTLKLSKGKEIIAVKKVIKN